MLRKKFLLMRRKSRRGCNRVLAIICSAAHDSNRDHMSKLTVGLGDKDYRRQEHQQIDAVQRRAVLGIAAHREECEHARGLDEGQPLNGPEQVSPPEHRISITHATPRPRINPEPPMNPPHRRA